MEPNVLPAVQPEIEISLSSMGIDNAKDMMIWMEDPKVTRYTRCGAYTCIDQAIEYITSKVIPNPYHKAICVNNRPIGAICVTVKSGEEVYRAELGYLIASAWWGKGIATKAVKMVTSTIFDQLPQLVRLEAMVEVDNMASQRILEKLGFTKEGLLRRFVILRGEATDVFMFSLLRTDPRPV